MTILYLLVTTIMNITAMTAMDMPMTMFEVSASPNTRVPTRIAVIGSNTPSTEVFVAPMFLVETARVAIETMVGITASPTRLTHAIVLSSPVRSSESEVRLMTLNTTAPTRSA